MPDAVLPLITFLPTTNGPRRLWSLSFASLNELNVICKDLIGGLMPFQFFGMERAAIVEIRQKEYDRTQEWTRMAGASPLLFKD